MVHDSWSPSGDSVCILKSHQTCAIVPAAPGTFVQSSFAQRCKTSHLVPAFLKLILAGHIWRNIALRVVNHSHCRAIATTRAAFGTVIGVPAFGEAIVLDVLTLRTQITNLTIPCFRVSLLSLHVHFSAWFFSLVEFVFILEETWKLSQTKVRLFNQTRLCVCK